MSGKLWAGLFCLAVGILLGGKTSNVVRSFDADGNVTQEISYGDTAKSGDEVTTVYEYVPNTSAYIIGLPARERVFAGVGTTGSPISENQHLYDGASSYLTAPSKGDETKTRALISSSSTTYAENSFEHDTYGNVTAVIDELGARTEATYDSTYHAFRIETRLPLYVSDARFKTSATWDARCGAEVIRGREQARLGRTRR